MTPLEREIWNLMRVNADLAYLVLLVEAHVHRVHLYQLTDAELKELP